MSVSSCNDDHRVLHSFPTRRSSDLAEIHVAAVLLPRRPPIRGRLDDLHPSRVDGASFEGAPHLVDRVVTDGRRDAYREDRKSTRLNSSHSSISYAVFCLKKKKAAEA